MGYDISPDECSQLLAQLDTTNDGCIDVDEFLAALVVGRCRLSPC